MALEVMKRSLGIRPRRQAKLFTVLLFIGIAGASVQPSMALAQEPSYTITDLGFLGSGLYSTGNAISPSGKTTGASASFIVWNPRAYLKDGTTMANLGTLGGDSSEGFGVNDAGQVVGLSSRADFSTHAFLYSGGTMIDLGTLGGRDSQAFAINTLGQVIGQSLTADYFTHAFLYTDGAMTDLGSLGGLDVSVAYGINDAAQIVGASYTPAFQLHAVLWSGGTIADLGTLGGSSCIAYGINSAGQVVGRSDMPGNTAIHAFLWSGGAMTDLGTLGGRVSQANAINASGHVVGKSQLYAFSEFTHAFLWSSGTMKDLNDLVPADSGWVLTEAKGINDAGQIVGTGTGPDGFQHGFLLTPVGR